MSGWNWPNFNTFISNAWGWPNEIAGPGLGFASNLVVGTNPVFTVSDFLSFYPGFGGTPLVLTGVVTQGLPVVTGLQATAGLLPGQAVASAVPMGNGQFAAGFFPDGTTLISIDSDTQITLSAAAIVNGGQVAFYNTPFVPMQALIAFVMLASSSLVYNRWLDTWKFGMNLFIAHYCTLYLRSNGDPATSAGQLAAAGLARGILVAKSAGGVSASVQPATQGSGLETWGSWTETEYGVQFATIARIIGGGPSKV